MLAARSRTMTSSRSSRILTEPRLQCRCCQVCPSDNRLLLLCHRNTPAAQFSRHGEVHHHRRDTSPQVTCQQSCSSRKRLNHLRWSSPVCSGGHLSCWQEISHDRDDRERHLILADWAKLVGRLGVRCESSRSLLRGGEGSSATSPVLTAVLTLSGRMCSLTLAPSGWPRKVWRRSQRTRRYASSTTVRSTCTSHRPRGQNHSETQSASFMVFWKSMAPQFC